MADAAHDQVGENDEVWASLCDEHHTTLEAALDDLFDHGKQNYAQLLSFWIKAQGGSARAAQRMLTPLKAPKKPRRK